MRQFVSDAVEGDSDSTMGVAASVNVVEGNLRRTVSSANSHPLDDLDGDHEPDYTHEQWDDAERYPWDCDGQGEW